MKTKKVDHEKCSFRCVNVLALASLLLLQPCLLAQNAPQTYTNPLNVRIGDPQVLRDNDGHYYMTGTGGPGYTSTNLVDWTPTPKLYTRDPATSWATGTAFWAAELYHVKDKYYLFYSDNWTNNPTHERENFRIGYAVSDSPTGPYKDVLNRPIFDPGYPAIDVDLLFDTDGRIYLYYSRCCYQHSVGSELLDWARQKGWYTNIEESWIYGVELKPDFSGVVGEPVLLLRPPEKLNDPQNWENLSVTSHAVNRRWTEAPTAFKNKNTYYLIYAANSVAGPDYATGYATSEKPLGPFKKAASNPIIRKNTESGGQVTTTAHDCVTWSPDRTEMFILYGAVMRTNTPGATAAPSVPPSFSPPNNRIPILVTNADGVVGTNGFRRRPGGFGAGGPGGRVLFLDRLEIKPDGTLEAHSPTVTPQPYPSSGKAPSK